jgi:prepilin-type N-terminal cleavage/methylation domain-containing protein
LPDFGLGEFAMHVRRRDSGFTLVELLVTISIMGIITVPLSNVVISYFRNTDSTTARLNESHDAQIAAAYWAQDVAGMGTRSTVAPYDFAQSIDSPTYLCSPGVGTPVVRFISDDYPSGPGAATQVRVAYVVETVSGQTQLHRIRCVGSSTTTSDTLLASDLDPSTLPSVACSTPCAAFPAIPASVTLTLSMKDPKDINSTAYSVVLTGQRRQT